MISTINRIHVQGTFTPISSRPCRAYHEPFHRIAYAPGELCVRVIMNDTVKFSIKLLCIGLFLTGCSNPTVTVHQVVNKDFTLPTKVQVKVVNQDWEKKTWPEGTPYMERASSSAPGHRAVMWYIEESLRTLGVQTAYDGKGELIFECRYNYGRCFPFFGRHFDIFLTDINQIDIKLMTLDGKLLGGTNFVGTWWHRVPNHELVSKMIGLILSREIRVQHPSINSEDISLVVVQHPKNRENQYGKTN